MFSLKGRVAMITGCGSRRGIGREAAVALAEQGATVAVSDLDLSGVADVVKVIQENGGTAMGIELDVTSESSVTGAVKKVLDEFGSLDILVNNAGISERKTIYEIDLEDMRRMFEINMFGLFNCTKAVLAPMCKQKYGRIISLASVAGKQGGGIFGGPHYSASKAAVLGFSKNVARQVAQDGITVNCVSPGLIDTDIWRSMPEDIAERIIASIPVGRPGTTREVAAVIAFLASEEAANITGEDIDINGGSFMD